jgi:hypothetical protein
MKFLVVHLLYIIRGQNASFFLHQSQILWDGTPAAEQVTLVLADFCPGDPGPELSIQLAFRGGVRW